MPLDKLTFPMANVDVELDYETIESTVESLVDRVGDEKNHTGKLPATIYMVPSWFQDHSRSRFNPSVVSIGPLHRGDENLKQFEVHKESIVHKFLHRYVKSCPAEQTLQSCVQKVIGSIDQIRDCYAEGTKSYTDVELAHMMVMDGCFILEFIYNYSNHWVVVRNNLLPFYLIYDLLLLENQIPFFVLDHIYNVILKFGFEGPLTHFMLPVLNHPYLFDGNLDKEKIGKCTPPRHILDLLHQCYWPRNNEDNSDEFSSSSYHSVVDLDRAGVRFKPNKDAKWLLAMEVEYHRYPFLSWFWAKPTFRMPVLPIHDHTELIFRNLIAYEQFSLRCNFVRSYVKAMDMLVNTKEDIAILVESKVLKNNIGSNDEAADMMNRLCKGIGYTNSLYSQQWKILDGYYNGYWPKHAVRLRRTYCGSPWNIIALVAGIVLFILTVVQTIYSVPK